MRKKIKRRVNIFYEVWVGVVIGGGIFWFLKGSKWFLNIGCDVFLEERRYMSFLCVCIYINICVFICN